MAAAFVGGQFIRNRSAWGHVVQQNTHRHCSELTATAIKGWAKSFEL